MVINAMEEDKARQRVWGGGKLAAAALNRVGGHYLSLGRGAEPQAPLGKGLQAEGTSSVKPWAGSLPDELGVQLEAGMAWTGLWGTVEWFSMNCLGSCRENKLVGARRVEREVRLGTT